MILVDIYIPAIDDTYDFMLDENACVEQIKEEIYEILSKKMKESKAENGKVFSLWDADRRYMLKDKETLYESGITDGMRMIYV